MSTPVKPWETNRLQNNGQILKNYNGGQIGSPRSVPVLPPRPPSLLTMNSPYSSYQPYSSYGSYGGYGGYSSYDMPYRSSMMSSYGSYGGYGMYNSGTYGSYGTDDAERRFIQYAEERSRSTFANVESIVRAFSSLAMMLDNTFFAMTSSFRAVLSVAENFGRLRNMFGHIWYSINIFRLFNWFYRKLMQMMGYKLPPSSNTLAWNEATSSGGAAGAAPSGGSNWPTLAFLGVLMSAPYFISKLFPKYEDKCKQENWKMPGVKAKAAFDFVATSSTEMSIQTNDEIVLAPKYIQDEMKLTNTGWAFAVCNGRSGVIPLNYLVLNMNSRNNKNTISAVPTATSPMIPEGTVPKNKTIPLKSSLKKVTFGENQIFDENSKAKAGMKEPTKVVESPQATTSTHDSKNANVQEKILIEESKKTNQAESSATANTLIATETVLMEKSNPAELSASANTTEPIKTTITQEITTNESNKNEGDAK